MKESRQALLILALLLFGVVVMGTDWLSRTAAPGEPTASAAEAPGPDGLFAGWWVWDPLSPEMPPGTAGSMEPLFGTWRLQGEVVTDVPGTDLFNSPFDLWGRLTETSEDEADDSNALNDVRFKPSSPESDGSKAPAPPAPPTGDPRGPPVETPPLVRLPGCGQRPRL
jgi:hypothetical protein